MLKLKSVNAKTNRSTLRTDTHCRTKHTHAPPARHPPPLYTVNLLNAGHLNTWYCRQNSNFFLGHLQQFRRVSSRLSEEVLFFFCYAMSKGSRRPPPLHSGLCTEPSANVTSSLHWLPVGRSVSNESQLKSLQFTCTVWFVFIFFPLWVERFWQSAVIFIFIFFALRAVFLTSNWKCFEVVCWLLFGLMIVVKMCNCKWYLKKKKKKKDCVCCLIFNLGARFFKLTHSW